MSRNTNRKPPPFLTTKPTYNHNHYIQLFDEMIDSPAYKALSHGAKFIYSLLCKEYKGDFTGEIVICPYSTLMDHGVRKGSIRNWTGELEALGFIKIISHGGLYKIPNKYRLINDWARFSDVAEAKAVIKAFNSKGYNDTG